MKIKSDDFGRYAEIRITRIDYCQACGRDFEDAEIVFYAIIDNNIICKQCVKAHAAKEPRLYLRDGGLTDE